jgi:phage shock protein A
LIRLTALATFFSGVLNGEQIVNLTGKVQGVYEKVDELDVKVKALTKRCQTLKQRMMEEIPGMVKKQINDVQSVSNFYRLKSNFNFSI